MIETASGGPEYVQFATADMRLPIQDANRSVGWTNRQMVGVLWLVLPVHGVHDRWLYACEEENQ